MYVNKIYFALLQKCEVGIHFFFIFMVEWGN